MAIMSIYQKHHCLNMLKLAKDLMEDEEAPKKVRGFGRKVHGYISKDLVRMYTDEPLKRFVEESEIGCS